MTKGTLIQLKKVNAKIDNYKLTIKQCKAESWEKYIDEMNENLDSGELFKRIKKK